MKYKVLSILLFATFLSFAPIKIFADTVAGTVYVQPAKVNVMVKPGEKLRYSLNVINKTGIPVSIQVSVKDFKPLDSKGNIEFYYALENSAQKWLIPQYTVINIPGFGAQQVDFIASADKEMEGKGYMGAVVFQPYGEDKKISQNFFAALILLNVQKEGITTGATISQFSSPFFQFKNPAQISFDLQNMGNANFSGQGTVSFYNIFGKEIKRFETGELSVYPGSTRQFDFAWPGSPLFGVYRAEAEVTNSLRQDNKVSGSSWFVFLPWQKTLIAAGIGILALAAVFFGIWYALRLRRSRRLKPSLSLK